MRFVLLVALCLPSAVPPPFSSPLSPHSPSLRFQEAGDDAKALVEKLVSENAEDQKTSADELVKLGKPAKKPVLEAIRKQSKPEIKARLERVALRIDAGTDAETGDAGPVRILLGEPTLAFETSDQTGGKKMLHLMIPITIESTSGRDEVLTLKKGTLLAIGDKVDLAVSSRDKKPFSWTVNPKSRTPSYNNLITPKWKAGTRIVVVFEFEAGGKTILLRTPVAEVPDK